MKYHILMISMLLLLAGTLGGCGGQPADDAGSQSETADSGTGSADSSVDMLSEASEPDFEQLTAKKAASSFTISYDVGADTPDGKQRYRMDQFFDRKSKIRTDIIMDSMQTRAYMLDDTMFTCSKQGEWQCFKVGDTEHEDTTEQFRAIEQAPDEYDITYQGTETVAGILAHCYGIGIDTGIMKYCLSEEGIPLHMVADIGGIRFDMIATSFKKGADPSAFDLPAKAVDMAEMMQQMQGMPDTGPY